MKRSLLKLLMVISLMGCVNKPPSQDPIPTHLSFKIESQQVNETRIINVWTPPEYSKSSDAYPVLYMPDGGIKEDFPHIANTIAELVEAKSIPPIILVGIENTERRRDLTGSSEVEEDEEIAPISDGASKFRAFINEELFKEVNTQYRTNGRKGIVGESLAGLFVVETFLITPDMFNLYIAMDPSLWWNNHDLVKTAKDHLAKFPLKEIKLWFAGSDAADISIHTNALAQILAYESPKSLIWNYSDEPNEKHNTIFRATKERAFEWALGSANE